MKITVMTMTLTSKRQTVFPMEWCDREGLANGGPLNVFDLGKDGLLIRPIKAPGRETVAKLLKQTPVGRHSPRQAAAIVNQALRQVRDESGRH
jgi:bifunctional DNA-binding transcriptional regulator/antitoxin component of YhaV-PrlF toxin-antitoxin module